MLRAGQPRWRCRGLPTAPQARAPLRYEIYESKRGSLAAGSRAARNCQCANYIVAEVSPPFVKWQGRARYCGGEGLALGQTTGEALHGSMLRSHGVIAATLRLTALVTERRYQPGCRVCASGHTCYRLLMLARLWAPPRLCVCAHPGSGGIPALSVSYSWVVPAFWHPTVPARPMSRQGCHW
jgi:hypothetical protein